MSRARSCNMVATALTIAAMRTRRLISAMLLLLQALGLQHLALSSHSFDDAGAAFEHAALASDSHHAEESHFCADTGSAEESAESCPVVASWLTAFHLNTARPSSFVPRTQSSTLEHARLARESVPLLSLAPKSSPPAS